ncbi:MAG TPA: hypothetical protein VE959_36620 [Bryobacteraceae bacterium]|nr:hypothetical protein [Bryobacteraceae bacterium]
MSVVIDSSAILVWVYSDETTEAIRRVFDRVSDHGVRRRGWHRATG